MALLPSPLHPKAAPCNQAAQRHTHRARKPAPSRTSRLAEKQLVGRYHTHTGRKQRTLQIAQESFPVFIKIILPLWLLPPPNPIVTGCKHKKQQYPSSGIRKLTVAASSHSSFTAPVTYQPSWTSRASAASHSHPQAWDSSTKAHTPSSWFSP